MVSLLKFFKPVVHGAHTLEDPIAEVSSWCSSTLGDWLDHCVREWKETGKINFCDVLLGLAEIGIHRFIFALPLHSREHWALLEEPMEEDSDWGGQAGGGRACPGPPPRRRGAGRRWRCLGRCV